MEVSVENQKEFLKKILPHIRFPLFNTEQLSVIVATSQLLASEDLLAVCMSEGLFLLLSVRPFPSSILRASPSSHLFILFFAFSPLPSSFLAVRLCGR
jgi:hypothetical protein